MRYDARKEKWSNLEILGVIGIFNDLRIDRKSIPNNLYFYELRDDCDGIPCKYAKGILVNFLGTFITKEPLPDDNDGFISKEDYNWLDNTIVTDINIWTKH